MRRRTALTNIGVISAGILLFPGCRDHLQLDWSQNKPLSLNEKQQIWIAAISESILPKSDLNLTTYESFPEFVTKMIRFDKSEHEQSSFVAGYNLCTQEIKNLFDNTVSEVQAEEIIQYFSNILEAEADSEMSPEQHQLLKDKQLFCAQIRRLSISHLKTSKEYQEDILKYKLVPEPYIACQIS